MPTREQIEAELARLPPEQHAAFLAEVEKRMQAAGTPTPKAIAEPPSAWERGVSAEKQRFGEFAEGFGEKAPEALLAAINPMTYVRAAGGAIQLASQPTRLPGALAAGAEGITELGARLLGLRGARGTGEAVGELLPAVIPVGEVAGMVGKLARTSRPSNIIQAVSETTKAGKANIERLAAEGRLNLPIAATRGGLQSKIEQQIAQAAPELEAAKGALGGEAVPLPEILSGILKERPGISLLREGPKGPIVKEVTGNLQLRSAIDSRINQLIDAAGYEGTLPSNVLQKFKEEAQDAATAAYKTAPEAGQEAAASARASELAAFSIKQALETSTAIPQAVRERLTAANRTMEPLLAVQTPLEARRLEQLGKPLISRSAEMLAGRSALPALAGAGAGAYALGPAGAAAGLGAGAFLQSALWNTLSAAGKARVAPILESEGVQAAVQAAFQTIIAENAARQQETPVEP